MPVASLFTIWKQNPNRQQATKLAVADSDFFLKSSNKLATGVLNGYEHCGALQTFLNQPLAYLNSTNFI